MIIMMMIITIIIKNDSDDYDNDMRMMNHNDDDDDNNNNNNNNNNSDDYEDNDRRTMNENINNNNNNNNGWILPVITSNEVPYLQMRPVGLHSMSEREKKGKKEMTGIIKQLDPNVLDPLLRMKLHACGQMYLTFWTNLKTNLSNRLKQIT